MFTHRYVGKFVPRKDRMKDGTFNQYYTNVYVKNFADDVDDDVLMEMFTKFGTIYSAIVMKDEMGKSKGFGFVSFESHIAASEVLMNRLRVNVVYCMCCFKEY